LKKSRIELVIDLLLVKVLIGIYWQLLEVGIYGEIQPRFVDTCVSIAWTAVTIAAFRIGVTQGHYEEREDDQK
jgi:hypothetical protein